MPTHKRESRKFAHCFRRNQRAFVDCTSSLEGALVSFFPRLTSEDLDELRAVMLASQSRRLAPDFPRAPWLFHGPAGGGRQRGDFRLC
jgi:hypothetical protein